jgi:phosphoglucosamine mutase
MARKLFGTDGIRGTANQPPMTVEIALRLGLGGGGGRPPAATQW